ncbi:MAG TPA: caspase family protein, partial [Labilithrix sp.]|nr:caspase family protein [Labilithrix sp.]
MNKSITRRGSWASAFTALVAAAALGTAGAAHADPPRPSTSGAQVLPSTPKPYAYGIFVGHNQGGPGQSKLRYAEGDAKLAADTLRDLGRYGTADMRVLTAPSPSEVLTAIDVVTARLREHQKRGEQAVLIFYFSGHAKANALDLADKELDLSVLRDRLRGAPSTLTLVVLDACQSGAFSRTKGVEAAKDFSTNSVARLTTRGIAVMASSASQELSQESDELHSSYFTHHFLVGLRGAGDLDRDGKVTLDEAYRYAYRSTLAATERTAVGGQHVTLETDLSGQGEVPLAFPREAKSKLELPAPMAGRVLLQHKASGSIVAEIQKSGGSPTLIALPAGDYEAIVRQGSRIQSCGLTLSDDRVTAFESATCVAQADFARPKGEGAEVAGDATAAAPPEPVATPPAAADVVPPSKPLRADDHGELGKWGLELGFGLTSIRDDAYFSRLRSFGYVKNDTSSLRLSAALTRNFGRY